MGSNPTVPETQKPVPAVPLMITSTTDKIHTKSNNNLEPKLVKQNNTRAEIIDKCITTDQLNPEEPIDKTLEHFCESHSTTVCNLILKTKFLCKEFLSLTSILDSKFNIKLENKLKNAKTNICLV